MTVLRAMEVRGTKANQKVAEDRSIEGGSSTTSRKLSSSIKLKQTWRPLAATRMVRVSLQLSARFIRCDFFDKTKRKEPEKKKEGENAGRSFESRHGVIMTPSVLQFVRRLPFSN